MTTQDIYAWVQMGLQIVIGGGIIVGISRYFGILRRAIDSQKATIEAQAEHMKAQSTVLQDVERLNKVMQQVIDFFAPQTQLQREQAYRERVDRDLKVLEDDMSKMRQEWLDAQTMARDMFLLLNKASAGLERSTTSLREACLMIQEDALLHEEERLVMQDMRQLLEDDIQLRQKLKGKIQEDKNREQSPSPPGHELTSGAKADGEGDNQP